MDRDILRLITRKIGGKKMLYEDLTGKILAACFEVNKELGIGFIESVYEKALLVALFWLTNILLKQ